MEKQNNLETAAKSTKSSAFFTRGWLMIMVVFITAICTQGFGLYSFSMIRVPMTEMLGADPTAVALGFSIYALVAGITSLIVGDVIEKLGLRVSMILSAVFFSGGFFILGFMNALWMVYAAYVSMGIGTALGGMVVVSGIPSNWFAKRRGIAIGVTWCATLPGSFITTFLVSAAAASGHWQNAPITLGIIAFVVLFASSFVLKWRPQEVGLFPDGMTAAEAAEVAERAGAAKLVGLNRKQALKTLPFWMIFLAFALIGIGEQGPFQNFPTYMVAHDYDLAAAGTFMTFLAFAGCCGKLSAGIIVDKLGPRWAYSIINYLAAIGLIAIMLGGDKLVVLYIAGFFFGAALSSSAVCFSNATAKFLGPKYFGQLYGIVFLGKPLMDSIGVPLITNISNGPLGWTAAYIVAAVFVIASATCMLFARKSKQLIAMEEEAARELKEAAAEG
ncbi:MAG: MFS transporter [Coriobacteriales bacterium]|jgi:sugar phosphate permease|nr:MFS transporter [Coriobacteriales bacterium]